jgi:hypothetical protein
MRFIFFLHGILILIGIPLILSQLGSPPATTPERMRESEIDALEFDRLQEEKALKQESSDPFSEEF